MSRFKLGTTGIVIISIVAAVFVFGIGFYSYAKGVRNAALQRELGLVATYQVNQTELSAYVSTFYEQTGIAGAKSDRMNQLVQDAISGRYGDEGFKGGTFAAAITEAYPDLKALDIYDKILPTIAAGREGFRNKQNLLIDKAREYDTWRKEGILRPMILSGIYPSSDLKITAGDQTYSGQQALDKLSQPILTAATSKVFESGSMEPLTVPSTK